MALFDLAIKSITIKVDLWTSKIIPQSFKIINQKDLKKMKKQINLRQEDITNNIYDRSVGKLAAK